MQPIPATEMDEFERNRETALVQSSTETNQGESAVPWRKMALPAWCAIPMAVGLAGAEPGKAAVAP